MMSNFSLSSLALLVLIARAACARRTFDYTTFSFSFTDASNSYDAELGVDLHNPAQQTQGRANVIAMQRTGLSQSLASYPLFDGSFLLELPSTSTSLCVYTEVSGWCAFCCLRSWENTNSTFYFQRCFISALGCRRREKSCFQTGAFFCFLLIFVCFVFVLFVFVCLFVCLFVFF
jgi:hypothetical protein